MSEDFENLCETIRNAFGDSDDKINIVDAIRDSFMNSGLNGDMSLVEAVDNLMYSNRQIASAITPQTAQGNEDATGGHVTSLTEAVMGVSAGLVQIADAINRLAEAHEP